ncbi:biotin-dependent carboxyltransferase family protein [Aeromicrobium sp.]|uniref:5-oxoprolinase subunit C family protein n=1 Tax=Aeromicrobium sp. TaxID=1871063 RepID=UPI0025C1F816|nr:biotin-dependent carboxyltransferase family protein [Aeromicrobium sp.]MCK5891261.1 biotin-dependent carboxyltransferase family protein [Aeromicrobium sp.]
MSLRVTAMLGSALVQDLGRPGRSEIGVSPSGVFDRRAARQANALVGNAPGAAVLEVVGALSLRASRETAVVVAGAPGPLTIDGVPASSLRLLRVPAGGVLSVGPAVVGLRRVVAFAGGIATDPVLGSRSTDTLAGLGPAPLEIGSPVVVAPGPVGPDRRQLDTGVWGVGDLTVRVVLGPRDDWFSADAADTLLRTGWTVSDRSDRIGLRLDGPPLERAVAGELESEAVVRGSIQVTSAGLPVVLGPDHPATGGYPVIGVVVDADTDLLAQAAPGRILRFRRHPAP